MTRLHPEEAPAATRFRVHFDDARGEPSSRDIEATDPTHAEMAFRALPEFRRTRIRKIKQVRQ